MAVSSTAEIHGNVMRTSVREGISKASGQPYKITTILVIGQNTLAECRVPEHLAVPKDGTTVHAQVVISSFRDEDQMAIEKWLA